MKAQKLNHRQAQWALYLLRFDFSLKHVPRTKMEKSDGLSRQPDWRVGIENDNSNQVFIKDNLICSLEEVVIKGPEVDILEKIKKVRSKNKEIVRVVEQMKKEKVKILQGDEWQIEGDLVLKEEKVYMLKDGELKVEIIQLYHNVLVAGHRSQWKTMELVIKNYWWLEVTRDVERYIEKCDIC